MLTFGEELSGSDLKSWADWSIGFYYWSPSVSQVYTELKKLETLGFVSSRKVSESGGRRRRVFTITESGIEALRSWSRRSEIETPVLKHGVMLRLWVGHLNDPDQLKSIVLDHIDNLEAKKLKAIEHADNSENEPAWAFTEMSLRWIGRHFQMEIDLAAQLLDDIDEAAARFAQGDANSLGLPQPVNAGSWKLI